MKVTDETLDEHIADMLEITRQLAAFADKWEMDGIAILRVEDFDIRKWNKLRDALGGFVRAVGRVIKLPSRGIYT